MNKGELLDWLKDNYPRLKNDTQLIAAQRYILFKNSMLFMALAMVALAVSIYTVRTIAYPVLLVLIFTGLLFTIRSFSNFMGALKEEFPEPIDDLDVIPTAVLDEIYSRWNTADNKEDHNQ